MTARRRGLDGVVEIEDSVSTWPHARVPLRDADGTGWKKLVIRRDVLTHLARDEFQLRLEDVARPLHTVRHTKPAHELLLSFLHHQTYLFAVADDRGEVLGVVALDDAFEAMLGRPIETEKMTTAK